MSCNNCESYTCTKDVFECLNTLRLGSIAQTATPVFVHVVKQNGAEYIHTVITDGSGNIDIDMTEPEAEFYSSYDGLYIIWATLAGYYSSDDRLSITAVGGTANTIGVKFRKATGNPFTTQHIEIVE